MAVSFTDEAPEIIKSYLYYMQTIKGKSPKTVDEYYLDLRQFFRCVLVRRGLTDSSLPFDEISIECVDAELIKSITLNDALEFMDYSTRERNNSKTTRARKASSIRSFFKYLSTRAHLLEVDPMKELELPKTKRALPKYLTLEQSIELLNSVDGKHKQRDYCIITLFLNCGMRLSELVGINMSDIRSDNTVRIVGKGNKERVVYLNDACINAIDDYRRVRPCNDLKDRNALFISNGGKRISPKTVQAMVYKYLGKIGLDAQGYSCHKLRHTAATLMYQHGNVDIRVLKDILGHENLGTTEIYTHLNSQQLADAANNSPLAHVKKKKKSEQNTEE